ncbi:hypothetical protein [Actinomadura rupiterrae]|uniref:hypothetical protein n=1 Tax=Actinomadura rupiterrae TaxID=559627 RepID=UPI0020A254BA|nr:hypothetical protein [Actinomadura rupiterrae]MCP2340291.1 hypothetical protein [Actinomadura rupiterrae]
MEGKAGLVRKTTVLLSAGLAALALSASACGSSGGDGKKGVAALTTGSPSTQGGGGGRPSDQQVYDGLLKYSKCMRTHGVSNFPDPVLGKGLQVDGNAVNGDTATYKNADTACKSMLPAGGGDHPAQDRAMGLKHSRCMRAHGVPKFPDPNPNGGANLDGDKIGMTPDNPVFQAAEKACQKYAGGSTQGG